MEPSPSMKPALSVALSVFFVLSGPLSATMMAPAPASAVEAVDLELVIATDVSRSIDQEEARLQREGVATAFLSKEVVSAIQSGTYGRIGVAYIDWSSPPYNKLVMDWHIVHDRASAKAFAETLLEAPLSYGWRTSISGGLESAARLFETNNLRGTRRVIDVSGDGPNNHGRLVDEVRDEMVAKSITINGLPIVADPDLAAHSRYYLPDLDKYFEGCVIGGAGAFIVVAKDFSDFARAIRKKLILEIAGRTPEQRPTLAAGPIKVAAAQLLPAQLAGPGYHQGCDIGERMRYRNWGDPDDP